MIFPNYRCNQSHVTKVSPHWQDSESFEITVELLSHPESLPPQHCRDSRFSSLERCSIPSEGPVLYDLILGLVF